MTVTPSNFADAIGRKKIADILGVGQTAVSNAVVRGWFPASWYVALKTVAEQQGLNCPPDLFKMRDISSQNVNSTPSNQEIDSTILKSPKGAA